MFNESIRWLYDATIRPYLPRKLLVRNQVVVNTGRILDRTTIDPTHKDRLIDAIREYVRPGDTVVVVGGGLGVDSVWAARESGPDGRVIAFEAASNMVSIARETARLNGVADQVTVKHAAIGEVKSDYGPTEGVSHLDPADLPQADVLVADCEGCEQHLLERLEIRPGVVIIECHPQFDAPVDDVVSQLSYHGYAVQEHGDVAEFTSPMVVVGCADEDHR